MIEKENTMPSKLPEYNYKSSIKKEEANIYRRIGIVATLTLFIVIILLLWGTTVINALGTFLSSFNRKNISLTSTNEFLAAPHLNVLPIATNSALLDIKGWANPKQEIQLTLNDVLVGKLATKDDGTFNFEAVQLREATNLIKAVILNPDGKTSDVTQTSIVFDKVPPKLEVFEPVNNLLVGAGINQVHVRGKTELGTTVSINDNQIILANDNTFDTFIPILPGENKVKITALDIAGNQTTVERAVTSQNPPAPAQ